MFDRKIIQIEWKLLGQILIREIKARIDGEIFSQKKLKYFQAFKRAYFQNW